uniref:Transmembrane protein n=1 Tax=Bursaphelenchus xylophilus TaxID=6326 RepID=A0A1I7RYK5_BURXY
MIQLFLVILISLLTDVLLTILGFGFYSTGFHFSIDILLDKLCPTTFDVRQISVDFLLLSAVRWIIVGIGVVLRSRRYETTTFEHGLNIFTTLSISYTLGKVLAFSEIEVQLRYPGLWLNVILNILISLLLPRFYKRFLSYLALNVNSYHRMENGQTVEPVENGTSNGNTALPEGSAQNVEAENGRRSMGEHIKALLGYCKLHIAWFGMGFLFLIVYSAGKRKKMVTWET